MNFAKVSTYNVLNTMVDEQLMRLTFLQKYVCTQFVKI